MLKAIIFDVDGVLIDSVGMIIEYYQKTGEVLGLKIPSKENILKLMGKPLEIIVRNTWSDHDPEVIIKKYRQLIIERKNMSPVEGAVETVKKFKDSNFKLGLVSSKKRFFIQKHLKEANFDINDFEVVVGAEDTEKNKPHPDPLIHACNLLGIKPEDTIYIGDALVDFASAHQAGIKFIGVLSGGLDEKIFRENGVENILKSVTELPNFLKIE